MSQASSKLSSFHICNKTFCYLILFKENWQLRILSNRFVSMLRCSECAKMHKKQILIKPKFNYQNVYYKSMTLQNIMICYKSSIR